MSEVCTKCFRKHDVFVSCDTPENPRSSRDAESRSLSSRSEAKGVVLGLVPFFAILLDFILPFANSIYMAILLVIFGSAIGSFLWVLIFDRGKKSAMFHLRNFKNYVYLPNMPKVFGVDSALTKVGAWISVVAAAVVLQLIIVSPGNASHIAGEVSAKIEDSSNQLLDVSCPSTFMFTFSKRVTCEIETGFLGLTVPARVTLTPLGVAKIDISLL